MSLAKAVKEAEERWQRINGKCSMCAVEDTPNSGMHRGTHRCGNAVACLLCHNAGMEYGDQCAACGRIEKSKTG